MPENSGIYTAEVSGARRERRRLSGGVVTDGGRSLPWTAVGADNGAGGQLMMNGVPLMNGSGVVEMHQVAPQAQHQPLGVHLSNVVSLGEWDTCYVGRLA